MEGQATEWAYLLRGGTIAAGGTAARRIHIRRVSGGGNIGAIRELN
jgi:hypothetical protein